MQVVAGARFRSAYRHVGSVEPLLVLVLMAGCTAPPAGQEQPHPPVASPAPAPTPSPAPSPPPGAVVFMGDSITHLWPDPPGINAGVDGNTTAQMLERFERDVLSLHPRVVVILGGTNDVYLQVSPTTDNLQRIADMARAAGACVVLGTIPPTFFQIGVHADLEETNSVGLWLARDIEMLARAYAYRLADYRPAFEGRPELFRDGLHPNEAGYAVMRLIVQPEIDACIGRQ